MFRKRAAKDQKKFDESYASARKSLGYGKKSQKNLDQYKKGFASPPKTSSSKVHGGDAKEYKKAMNPKMRRATKT